jgi:phosphate transport system substrate-binding protein
MNKGFTAVFVGFFTLVFVLSVSHEALSDELVVIWGSTTCQKRFLEPVASDLRKDTGLKINVNGVGTGRGLIALLDGKVQVSAASEDLEGAINSAKKVAAESGRDLEIPENLVFNEIILDHIIPIVHKDNAISELTWEDLGKLSTGEISNWQEVGGANLPVQVITSHTGSATKAVFQKLVMGSRDYASDAIMVDSTRKEILAVSKNTGAVGAVSDGFLKMFAGDTKPVRTKKITRPLGLITISTPQPDVQKVIDYLRTKKARKNFL